MTSKSSQESTLLISSMDILEIGLEHILSLTFEDDLSLDLISELLKSLVFGPLFSGLSSLLLPDLVLLLGLYSICFSLLDSFIFGLDASCMAGLRIKDSVNNYFL